MKKHFLLIAACCLLFTDCARSSCEGMDVDCSLWGAILFTPAARGRGAYIANNAAATVTAFKLDVNSRSMTAAGSVATGGTTRGTAVDSSRSILYASVISIPAMLSYSIDRQTGALTFLRSNSMPNANANTLAIDPTGKFIFAAGTTQVQTYQTDGLGGVSAVGSLFTVTTSSRKPAMDPTGTYLYYGDGAATFRRVNIASDGSLSNLVSPACGATASYVALSRDGSLIHCFNATTSNVNHYRLQADGSLVAAGTYTPGSVGYTGGVYNKTGEILYIIDSTANLIRPHRVDASSAVTLTPTGTNVSVAATVDDIAIDGSGQFLIALSTGSMSTYSIGSDQVTLTLIQSLSSPTPQSLSVYSPLMF